MRKVIGWILIVFGGFIFISCVICIPAIFITGSIPFMERIFSVILLIFLTIICGMICCLGIKIKKRKVNVHLNSPTSKVSKNTELMTSQLPALYLQKNNTMYRDEYMMRLENIGFQKADAEKIFDFECKVIRKFDKQYLLGPKFTKNSHEKELPEAVWKDICEWRLKGSGAEFAIQYFKMIEKETGIPEDALARLSSEQGKHLSQYKW